MIVYIYNIGVDLYNGFNGLRHRINWTYFSVLDGLAHPLYSTKSSVRLNRAEIKIILKNQEDIMDMLPDMFDDDEDKPGLLN